MSGSCCQSLNQWLKLQFHYWCTEKWSISMLMCLTEKRSLYNASWFHYQDLTVLQLQVNSCAGSFAGICPRPQGCDGTYIHGERGITVCSVRLAALSYQVEFVLSAPANVVASITSQHMTMNRNHLFEVCCTAQDSYSATLL